MFANPIVHGNWPDIVVSRVEERSTNENFTRSRLPQFTDDEIVSIKGSYDFIGFNFHDTRYVADTEEAEYGVPSFEYDMKTTVHTDEAWLKGSNGNTVIIQNYVNYLKNV